MARKYEKVQQLLPKVKRLKDEGYTHREIAEKLKPGNGIVEWLMASATIPSASMILAAKVNAKESVRQIPNAIISMLVYLIHN